MDEGMTNYAENRVIKKVCGVYKLKRILLIVGFVLLPFVILIVAMSIPILKWMLWLTPLTFTMALVFGKLAFRYLQIEYEYSIVSGIIKVEYVYGNAIRKDFIEVKISDMSLLAPYQGEYKAKADAPDIINRYEAVSSLDAPDVYCGIFLNEKNEKSVLLFEASKKALGIAKFYNRNAVMKETRF